MLLPTAVGARKTENVFAIQTPVAIAVGVRYDTPQPTQPARVYHTRISGTQQEKLAILGAVERFSDIPWRACFADWTAPFLPTGDTPYWQWPLLTDLFPWQTNGMQFKRSWPIGETREVLEQRWKQLVSLPVGQRGKALKESEARTIKTSQELHVGKGVFTNVRPDVWNFSVSGLQVVKSWLDYRMRDRAGKKSSPLDEIRPASWQFDDELLDLLWMLEATLDLLPQATSLLNRVLAGHLFGAADFPKPKDTERRGPAGTAGQLPLLDAAGVEMEDVAEEGDDQ